MRHYDKMKAAASGRNARRIVSGDLSVMLSDLENDFGDMLAEFEDAAGYTSAVESGEIPSRMVDALKDGGVYLEAVMSKYERITEEFGDHGISSWLEDINNNYWGIMHSIDDINEGSRRRIYDDSEAWQYMPENLEALVNDTEQAMRRLKQGSRKKRRR